MASHSILIPDGEHMEPAEDVVRRGQLAEQILENPMFAFALREAERDALLEWQSAEDPARREQIWAELQFKERLLRMLNAVVQDAEVLQHIQEQL